MNVFSPFSHGATIKKNFALKERIWLRTCTYRIYSAIRRNFHCITVPKIYIINQLRTVRLIKFSLRKQFQNSKSVI